MFYGFFIFKLIYPERTTFNIGNRSTNGDVMCLMMAVLPSICILAVKLYASHLMKSLLLNFY